jgi:ribosome-associated protein
MKLESRNLGEMKRVYELDVYKPSEALSNMVNSGGEAKYVISEGQVIINGKVETRKRKKIFSGDVVEFGKEEIRIQVK